MKYHQPKPANNKYTYSSLIAEKNKPYTKPLRIKAHKTTLTDLAKKIIEQSK